VWFRLVAGGGGGEASSERSRGCRGVVERGDEEMVAGNGHGWSEGLEAEQRRHGIGMGGGAAALGLGGLSVASCPSRKDGTRALGPRLDVIQISSPSH
jgi:hypothetical protein